MFGDSTDYDATGWVLDIDPETTGPSEWMNYMARLKYGDGKGAPGNYKKKKIIQETGGLNNNVDAQSSSFATGNKEYQAASPFESQEGFTQGGMLSVSEDLDAVFDAPAKPTEVAEEVIAEPQVKVSKKKQDAPKPDVDLASLLDEFDD